MAKKLEVAIVGNVDDLLEKLDTAEGGVKDFGKNLTKTLTPVAAGIAALGILAFKDWHEATSTLQTQTGKTGDALKDLEDSLGDVAKQAPESLSEIADVMADLSAKTELVGDPLETLTDQFLDLKRMGMDATVDTVADAFSRWDVASEDLGGSLDLFFVAAQESGIAIDDLADSLAKFAPALQGFGLTFPEAVALLASFEEEGVPAAKAMGGLTKAFGDWASKGKDPIEELKLAVDRIKAMKDPADRAAAAIEIFGKKAGPEMAKAISSGSFDLDALLAKMEDAPGKIDATADSQQTLNDKFAMFKNRVFDALGPYGEMIGLIGGGVASIGPSIVLVAELATAYKELKKALEAATAWQLLMNAAAMVNPYILAAAAIIILAAAFYIAYQKSERFRTVVDWLIDHFYIFLAIPIVGSLLAMAAAAIWVYQNWDRISAAIEKVVGWIETFIGWVDDITAGPIENVNIEFQRMVGYIQTAIGWVQTLIGWIGKIPLVNSQGGVSQPPGGGRGSNAPGSAGASGGNSGGTTGGAAGGHQRAAVNVTYQSLFPPTEEQQRKAADFLANGLRSQGYRQSFRISPGV